MSNQPASALQKAGDFLLDRFSQQAPARLGYGGGALLTIGLFLPAVHVGMMGDLNWVQVGPGKLLFILGIATLILVYMERFGAVLAAGIVGTLITFGNWLQYESQMSQARSSFLGSMMSGMIELRWGFYPVLVAPLALIAAWVAARRLKEIGRV